jgi:photosystem II stability/assembly factor-like uncharacterized protein
LRFTFALAAFAACAAPLAAQRWRMQYLHDDPKTTLTIVDLQFPSATRGVAVGITASFTGKNQKQIALVTSDGGAQWQTVPLKGDAGPLFFLNETLGWMVSGKALWKTTEAGKNWIRLPNPPARVVRVFFKDENTGWAACANKTVLETRDGGQHWDRVAAASEPPGDAESTAYGWIAFPTPEYGIIAGWNSPPTRLRRFNDWMEPEVVANTREFPRLNLTLSTHDGGKTWKASSVSMFGEITRIRIGAPGKGLALVEHTPSFQYPSEVHTLAWPNSEGTLSFRDKNVFITDVWVSPGGAYYIAGVSTVARARVVPQKVRVFRSDDGKDWKPVPVDYRAVANRAILAGAGDGSLWMATNNGMILKLSDK